MKLHASLWLCCLISGCGIFGDSGGVSLRADGGAEPADATVVDTDADGTVDRDVGTTDVADANRPDATACSGADLENDPANCGACGQPCLSECVFGVCDAYVVAYKQDDLSSIGVDQGYVYWTNETPGSVWRARLDGREPEVLARGDSGPDQMNPRHLQLTATDIIVSVENSGTLNHAKPLFRIPKSGGAPSGFGAPIADGTADFAIDGSLVYAAFPRQDRIHVTSLGADHLGEIGNGEIAAYSVAVFNDRIYFAGEQGVGVVPVADGPVTMLHATDIPSAVQVRTDGVRVYVASSTGIFAIDPATPDSLINLQTGLFRAESLAVTSDRVFFLTGVGEPSGSLWSVNKSDGSNLTEVVSVIANPGAVAADEQQVYWTSTAKDVDGTPGTGQVLRLPYF